MKTGYGPWIRIFLRYVIGGVFVSSPVIGEQLAADPDVIAVLSGLAAVTVEGAYAVAKKNGWTL